MLLYFQDWDRQSPTQVVTEMCGFVTILGGTFLLHRTKDMVDGMFPFIIFIIDRLSSILTRNLWLGVWYLPARFLDSEQINSCFPY